MTAKLEIVANDAGEHVRREHNRALATDCLVSVYRFAKLATLHDLSNQAFTRQLDETARLLEEYGVRSGRHFTVLFARRAVFVSGQLLRASRGVYENAAELAELLDWCGGSELRVGRDVTVEDLSAFAEALSLASRSERGKVAVSSARIVVRKVPVEARFRGLELEEMDAEQRIGRTFASAVVLLRRLIDDVVAGGGELPRQLKRVAQQIVDLSEASKAAYLGVTEARNVSFDDAGRAINTAIVAVATARAITNERPHLAQIAMAAMLHDIGRARAKAQYASSDIPGMGPSALSEDDEDRMPAGTAAVLTRLGRLNEATIRRTVVAYETQWLRRSSFLGLLYMGQREATLHARVVYIARRYTELLTPEPGHNPPPPDYAVGVLSDELTSIDDRTILRALVAALGLMPVGTLVRLSTRDVAEVIPTPGRKPHTPPRVRLMASGRAKSTVGEVIDLAEAGPSVPTIAAVISTDGWSAGATLASSEPERDEIPVSIAPPAVETARPPPSLRGKNPPPLPARPPPAPEDGGVPSPSAAGARKAADPPPDREPSQKDDPPRSRPALSQRGVDPLAGAPPTAEGTLAQSPLIHLLVYLLDQGLTGTLALVRVDTGAEERIYFADGVAAKASLSEPVTPIGEVLIRTGVVPADVVERAANTAQRLGARLGEYLVSAGVLPSSLLVEALGAQLRKQIVSLVNLPPETQFRFFENLNGVLDNDILTPCDPIDLVVACSREWFDRARIFAFLKRMEAQTLVLCEESSLAKLDLTEEEQIALAVIQDESPSIGAILEGRFADADAASSLCYALVVTRQFLFTADKGPPLGARTSTRMRAADAAIRQFSALPLSAFVDPLGGGYTLDDDAKPRGKS